MKKFALSIACLFLICMLFSSTHSINAASKKIPYPKGYRHWTHVKTAIYEESHPLYSMLGGFHHIYANKKALKAMKEGIVYPDGSVLVLDLLKIQRQDGEIKEGPRIAVAVMQKNSRKFKDTGGWGFEEFKGNSLDRIVTDGGKSCFACHAPRTKTDYTFSIYRK